MRVTGDAPYRFLFDCSFTTNQPGEVGITRVVRKLAAGVRYSSSDRIELQPVVYSLDGWHAAELAMTSAASGAMSRPPAVGPLASLLRSSANLRIRRWVRRILPLPAQELAWWTFSALTYGRLAHALPPIRIRRGDCLVLCDASWNYQPWSQIAAARSQGARVVTMVHDLIPLNHPQFCAPLLTRIFRRWLASALALSDVIMCNSAATRREVEDYCRREGLRHPPIGTFRLGVDLPEFAAHEDLRPALTSLFASSAPMILVVGSIEPRKNHAVVLDACERLWRSSGPGSDLRLVIAGRPADGADAVMRRIAHHPEQGGRLTHFMNLTDGELDVLYRRATALVFASWAEGFGLPLAEARQRGCRVVASRIPAFAEQADAGVGLFDPGSEAELADLLCAVCATPPASIYAMPRFSWAQSAEQFVYELERLLP